MANDEAGEAMRTVTVCMGKEDTEKDGRLRQSCPH